MLTDRLPAYAHAPCHLGLGQTFFEEFGRPQTPLCKFFESTLACPAAHHGTRRHQCYAIKQRLITLEAVARRNLRCPGLVLNQGDFAGDETACRTNRRALEELAGVPILFEICRGQTRLELRP